MYSKKLSIFIVLIVCSLFSFAQKSVVSGIVIDGDLNQPLEYATITIKKPISETIINGGITNAQGKFEIEVEKGVYDISIEFISYQTITLKNKSINKKTDLGTIKLKEDTQQLEGVEIRAERTSVEMRLDKKVYNVGQDLMVKGGTISDVLDNVPSLAVDAEGSISLRGNENVRVLIDGKPSGLAGINIADALRLLPADAIDKVEVITNPSARYDAEGSAGLINIILKKGKIRGLNGVITANTGYPDNHGLSANFNYRTKHANFFTTQGLNYSDSPGTFLFETEYLNPDGSFRSRIDDFRDRRRIRKGYNGNFGVEMYLSEKTTWTNAFTFTRNRTNALEDVTFSTFNNNMNLINERFRTNNGLNFSENYEIATNFKHQFNDNGHELIIDALYTKNINDEFTDIVDSSPFVNNQIVLNDASQNRSFVSLDYVLPIGEFSRFEAGYRGDFLETNTDFRVGDEIAGIYFNNINFSNLFQYKEKVNALYTQFGSRISEKFNYLLGLRWEDSNIDVNQLTTNDLNKKRYNNFFPSAFLNYEMSESQSASISYSRRVQRPRGRFLNPFSNISSNINIFRGDPDLDPAFTHAFDMAYIKRWTNLTFNTSAYYNYTQEPFQFIRRESGIINEEGVPILFTGPTNVGFNERIGFEVTFNYSPFKWWKINNNYNFFRTKTGGDFTYDISPTEQKTISLDVVAFTWFTRLNSKITLPGKVDWQTNLTYNAPENTAQGRIIGITTMNLAFSKDVLKDQGTVAFNISDVFNTRRRIFTANVPNVLNSYSDIQWRVRQFTLSFTYRLNQSKRDAQKQQRKNGGDFEGGDMMG